MDAFSPYFPAGHATRSASAAVPAPQKYPAVHGSGSVVPGFTHMAPGGHGKHASCSLTPALTFPKVPLGHVTRPLIGRQ